jgi:hypothetical protein
MCEIFPKGYAFGRFERIRQARDSLGMACNLSRLVDLLRQVEGVWRHMAKNQAGIPAG